MSHTTKTSWFALRAAALGLLAIWLGLSGGPAARAQATGHFALNATGSGVSCDAPDEPTQCDVDLGGSFTLSIDLLEPPAGGYVAVQTQLLLDGLIWTPASPQDENVWPDNQLPVRNPEPPGSGTVVVSHGGLTGLTAPLPVSHYEGSVVELSVSCPQTAATFDPALIAYEAVASPIGTSISLEDATTVPAATIGHAQIDVVNSGEPQEVPIADILTIRCGGQSAPPGDGVPGYVEGPATGPDGGGQPGTTPGATAGPSEQQTPGISGTPGASGTGTPIDFGGPIEEEDDDGGPWLVIGIIVGVVVVAGAAGGGWWYLRRRQAS